MLEQPRSTETMHLVVRTFRSQLIPLFLIASIFLLNFTSRIVLAPLLPTIENNLGLSHGDAGSLFFFLSIGYFISLLGSGHISSRISHKKTIAVSAIAVGIALSAISFSKSLFTLRCCVFLLGISAGTYLPSGITTITSLVNSKDWGKAMAIHELAPKFELYIGAPAGRDAPSLVFLATYFIFDWNRFCNCWNLYSPALAREAISWEKHRIFPRSKQL